MKIIIAILSLLSIFFTSCTSKTKNKTETVSVTDTAVVQDNTDTTKPAITEGNTLALALSSNAIQIITKSTGSTSELGFGAPEDRTIEVVQKVLKTNPSIAINSECGAGPLKMATWDNGLTLLFQEGKGEWLFVGWAANQAKNNSKILTTMAGIGVGSTRKEMEEAYVIKVDKTTLGYEFSTKSNDLFGIFERAGENAKITNMWSGLSCNFR